MAAAKTKLVSVRIVDGAVLLTESGAVYAGHELEVTEADAKALEAAGTAVRIKT